jgi:hypothetical protein
MQSARVMVGAVRYRSTCISDELFRFTDYLEHPKTNQTNALRRRFCQEVTASHIHINMHSIKGFIHSGHARKLRQG